MKDYYKILNVAPNATIDEIKRSYRILALKYHPDRNNGNQNFENIFKAINEAYAILGDVEKRKKYDFERAENSNSSSTEANFSPSDFLKIVHEIKNKVINVHPVNVNSDKLFSALNELLSKKNVDFLVRNATSQVNQMIINEILICSSFISNFNYQIIRPKLIELAVGNEELIRTILFYKQNRSNSSSNSNSNSNTKTNTNSTRASTDRQQSKQNHSGEYRAFFVIILVVFLIIFFAAIDKNSSDTSPKETYSLPNGELNNSFQDENSAIDSVNLETNLPIELNEKEKLEADGWKQNNLSNGQMPSCYNYKPKRGNINNKLEVHVGGGTDVVIKVMNIETNKCVRYVYINSGSTYDITNIPEGQYYLKIAYGKNWYSKTINNRCEGKFLNNPLYEKGSDIMDFKVKYYGDSYSIPSFQLQLDVISNQNIDTFNSHNISETEFND